MENEILANYLSALESYENIETRFHGDQVRHYPTILKELQQCLHKIEKLIGLETNYSTIYPIALFQLKQQMNCLINLVNEQITKDEVNNNHGVRIALIPSCNCSKNLSAPDCTQNVHNSSNSKEKQNLLNIAQQTLQTPKVNSLNEVAGLWDVKKNLKSLILLPKRQPQLFENRSTTNSVLLYGPPGTGKTRLVHALAAEGNMLLYSISASDIFSAYIGQSEKIIKTLFEHIKQNNDNHSILFIDEIDGFCRKRSSNEHEYSRRLKTELMCQLSDIDNHKNMFVICATNCPWDLDTAILRRFQKRIHIPLPNRCERLDILRLFIKNHLLTNNEDTKQEFWEILLNKTDGCSGSDLADLVQNALNIPITELEDCKIWNLCEDGFYEPIVTVNEEVFTSNFICSELSDLPSNSVRARKVQMYDFIIACESLSRTVSINDNKKYQDFD